MLPSARMSARVRRFVAAAVLAASALAAACGSAGNAAAAAKRPVVVQGAMDVEIRNLAASLQNSREERVHDFLFWVGTIDGYPVVVSKTLKGMENAAAATA